MTNTQHSHEKVALVTGSAGFLGSNLCYVLLSQGYTVYGVDNFITGNKENIEDLNEEDNFTFVEFDITSPAFVAHFKDIPLTHIYNLACPTGVPNIATMGEEMLETCSTGVRHVLGLARLHGASFLHTSTAEVYGDPEVFPQAETYTGNVSSVGPRSPYEEGKRFAESLIVTYTKKYNLETRIVRVFNTYGERMSLNDSRAMSNFLNKMINGEPLVVYGDGSQNRTFIYVEDLVRALMVVMESGIAGEVYNAGGDKQHTILEVAELMIKISNKDHEIKLTPHFISDHKGRLPDTTKLRSLGWTPIISLEEGLRRFMKSHQQESSEQTVLSA